MLEPGFDVFVSYASVWRLRARAVQHYLQSAGPAGAPRLTVYLDETDIRGGELKTELGLALDSARQLVVCCSPEAADSRWVGAEIQRFLRNHTAHDIVLAWLAGPLRRAVPAELDIQQLRVHDLRRWWFNRWPWPRTGVELARMYAHLAGLPLRQVIDWERRRTTARLAGMAVLGTAVTGTSIATVVHQAWTSEASLLLDQLAVEATRDEALRATRRASMAVRQRAAALVATQPARAAVAVRSGWPVAVIGLDGDLATELLPALRAALVTTEGEHIPAPRLENYRYAVGMVGEQKTLRAEARALLKDVANAQEVQGDPDGIHWLRARRAALMVGYLDVLERLDDPGSQLDDLRRMSASLGEESVHVDDALDGVEAVLRKRRVVFQPLREGGARTDASDAAAPAAPAAPSNPGRALREARSMLAAHPRHAGAAADYARAVGAISETGLLDAEMAAIDAMLRQAGTARPDPELLKMAAALAARRPDAAFTARVAGHLAAAMAVPAPKPLLPPFRGAGFVNFPAPLNQLPPRLLDTADPRVLVHFVARYATLGRTGLEWGELRAAAAAWNDVAAAALGTERLIGLIRQERNSLDNPLFAPWAKEMAENCAAWLRLIDDAATLSRFLNELAPMIGADVAGDRAAHLLGIYEAAGSRLWADLKAPPGRDAVAQVLALLPHPMWSSRLAFVAALTPTWAPGAGQGLGPFLRWARDTHGLSPTLQPAGERR